METANLPQDIPGWEWREPSPDKNDAAKKWNPHTHISHMERAKQIQKEKGQIEPSSFKNTPPLN